MLSEGVNEGVTGRLRQMEESGLRAGARLATFRLKSASIADKEYGKLGFYGPPQANLKAVN